MEPRWAIVKRDGTLDVRLVEWANKVVEIRPRKSKRSQAQNRYMHRCIFRPMSEHTGDSIPQIKTLMMGECWGYTTIHGRQVPIMPNTAEMSVEENTYFIDWAIPWAMTEFGKALMLPGEKELPPEDEIADA